MHQHNHWHRFVKNIEGVNPNLGGNAVKTDKCTGVSQILGARALAAPPKSTPLNIKSYYTTWAYLDVVLRVQSFPNRINEEDTIQYNECFTVIEA